MHPIFSDRQTVHLFNDTPVSEDALHRALMAAQLAPCHKFSWPWRFVRVGPEGRAALHSLACRLKFPEGVPARLVEKLRQKFLYPQLVVACQVRSEDAFRSREDYAAVACAIQNACLSLAQDGIGSKWSTGGVTRAPETYAQLGVDAAVEEIVGFVFIGHAAEMRPRPERPPISEVYRVVP